MVLGITRGLDSFLIVVGAASAKTEQVGLPQLCCFGNQKSFLVHCPDYNIKNGAVHREVGNLQCKQVEDLGAKFKDHHTPCKRGKCFRIVESNLLTWKCSDKILLYLCNL